MSATDVRNAIQGLLLNSLGPDQVRAEEGAWSGSLWQRLADLGMTAIDVPEASGGAGGSLEEALEVVRLCGYHHANLPIVDAGLVGSWLRGLVGLPAPGLPDAVALDAGAGLNLIGNSPLSASGELLVGWGRFGGEVLVVRENAVGAQLLVIERTGLGADSWVPELNLAGETRDRLVLKGVTVKTAYELPVSFVEVQARWSLGTVALMLGAMERVTELAIEQVRTREQFGRPLAKFQVIAHQVATMVAQLATVRAALTQASISVAENGTVDVAAAAAAKIRAGAASEIITQLGHQVHGAIGVTQEHSLGLATRRLWAWREESGDEQSWAAHLGRDLASRAHTTGLWDALEPID